jgi:DNA (cytosine-5)-methyltransferase 1
MSGTYYNEFDPKAAAWLRELIKAGLIPDGHVDERSIVDVNPYELTQYTQHHFFAGIGGWAYALRLAGWPDNRRVVTASLPCQPFSAAGKQLGTKDERHLWPVFCGIFTFLGTTDAFGEQVASAAGRDWLTGVRTDLEALGYEVGAADLCAAGVGAPHIRQRIYWMAHAKGERRHGGTGAAKQTGRALTANGGSIRGLADSNGGQLRDGGLQPSRQHGQQPEDGGAGRLEHAESLRLLGGPDNRDEGRRECAPGSGGKAVGLGNADGRGLFQHVQRNGHEAFVAGPFRANVDGSGADQRMDDANSDGTQRPRRAQQGTIIGCWDSFDLVLCTDNKARRIEPESFPLAHGVPGRVGLLRGYGNAIVPELAAQFIKASTEAIA